VGVLADEGYGQENAITFYPETGLPELSLTSTSGCIENFSPIVKFTLSGGKPF
jgi:hypothetical protein